MPEEGTRAAAADAICLCDYGITCCGRRSDRASLLDGISLLGCDEPGTFEGYRADVMIFGGV